MSNAATPELPSPSSRWSSTAVQGIAWAGMLPTAMMASRSLSRVPRLFHGAAGGRRSHGDHGFVVASDTALGHSRDPFDPAGRLA